MLDWESQALFSRCWNWFSGSPSSGVDEVWPGRGSGCGGPGCNGLTGNGPVGEGPGGGPMCWSPGGGGPGVLEYL